jgi:hypothetical protein
MSDAFGSSVSSVLRRRGLTLALTVAGALLAACAARMGGSGTEAALEELRKEPPEGSPQIARVLGNRSVHGALEALSSPEGLEQMSTIVDTAVTRALQSTLHGEPAAAARDELRSVADRAAHDAVMAFSAELRAQLGEDGRGPLGTSLAGMARHASSSAVAGADEQLAALFPGCTGENRTACLEVAIHRVARAASAGFVEGAMGALPWRALALAFTLGVVSAMAARGAWKLLRGHPPRGEGRA